MEGDNYVCIADNKAGGCVVVDCSGGGCVVVDV